ncbi:MAG: ion transporter [Promethearchaeota archaeon]|jgi:voltage-gated potassium channel
MKVINPILKALIWLSVGLFFVELGTGSENSHQSHHFFLWAERVIASVFTIEYLMRWTKNKKYPLTAFGLIDLLAIFPFWVGFFVPPGWLGLVRSLRILRLFKFFRYSRGLQLVALGFYRAIDQIKYLCFPVMIAILFSTVAMYEAEHAAQPEAFKDLFDAFWFTMVTATTVGYGDISPATVIGKIIAMVTFVSVLSLFAGFIGVIGGALSKVLDEEVDPNIDPISMFKETKLKK